jgi:NDP-sugar pyrophosphorylase family protein
MIIFFPVAGKAERFGGTFKPRLKFHNNSFLKMAFKSFKNIDFKFVYSIHNQKQEDIYSAKDWLYSEIPSIRPLIIQNETLGPLQTVVQGMRLIQEDLCNFEKHFVICDCDHWLDLTNFDENLFNDYDVVLPLWEITNEGPESWLIATINDQGQINGLEEKPKIYPINLYKGVIGCYFFKSFKIFDDLIDGNRDKESISDVLQKLPPHKIGYFNVERALFFGDKVRLEKAKKLYKNVKKYIK